MSAEDFRRLAWVVGAAVALVLLVVGWPTIHAAFTVLLIDAAGFVRGCF